VRKPAVVNCKTKSTQSNGTHAEVLGRAAQSQKGVAVSVGLSAFSASVKEQVNLREQIGSPFEPTHAFVAILDALGVRTYSKQQVKTFLKGGFRVRIPLSPPVIVL
jgi:hypothetical protein